MLMAQLALACKATSRACAKAGTPTSSVWPGSELSGDDQKKLDVLSNDIFINALVVGLMCCAGVQRTRSL